MRTAFVEALLKRAKEDPRVTLCVGDLGFGVVTEFRDALPSQFVNVGVAEQNMIGVAAGMAMEGRIVFTYSIANFATLRCLEQIRNDVCFHDLPVTMVAVGGGFAYGALGHTHHATEDLAILRTMPGIKVFAPGDPVEARLVTNAIIDRPGPCYLRLGKAGEPVVHADGEPVFVVGEAIVVRDGADLTLMATGGMLHSAKVAAEQLVADGLDPRVLSVPTLHPIDERAIVEAAEETGAILTIEEHSVYGGLGGAVAEVLAEWGAGVVFRRLGIRGGHVTVAGSQDYLRAQSGLAVSDIVSQALAVAQRVL